MRAASSNFIEKALQFEDTNRAYINEGTVASRQPSRRSPLGVV